jgi:thiamine pyrophosphate-dependent acetolactate synthase large subunit-like protein
MPEPIDGHGGELALAALRAFGVTEMFTLSGGHVFPLYAAAHRSGFGLYDVRHEQSAVFAAEAVAKLRRRPGPAVLTAGPGVTNGISGLTGAHFNGSPVLVLVLDGRAPAFRWGGVLADGRQSLVRQGLPVVIVVGNNGMWGLGKHPMRAMYGFDVAADRQPGLRYDEVVRALGGAGETVARAVDLGPALRPAFDSGVPYLVNVLTDPADAYPRSSSLA